MISQETDRKKLKLYWVIDSTFVVPVACVCVCRRVLAHILVHPFVEARGQLWVFSSIILHYFF